MKNQYRPTIGLEIHAELATRTKMFCGCRNDPAETRPNANICPVCMAHPGTLPVMNVEAVRKVRLVGAALSAALAEHTWFDRKNYFYPDIPKGYQISQYKDPLVSGGTLAGVAITRVHLEEDTARSSHEGNRSLVDFNRAGVPLMELVTEPVIHDGETAGRFARELQLLLRYLGASEANMEKGQMRVEANISVSKQDAAGSRQLGTKVEVKNLNSFRSVERAIAYEVERQIALIESGGEVVQETRGWDEHKQATFSQRSKESAHDYRYFPEPDLPAMRFSELPELSLKRLRDALPELPDGRRKRYSDFGIKADVTEILAYNPVLGGFFDAFISDGDLPLAELGANYLLSDIKGAFDSGAVSTEWLRDAHNSARFGSLMRLVAGGTLSSRGAKDTLALMYADGRDPETIAREENLIQQSDVEALKAIAQKVIGAHPQVVEEYKAGKTSVLQFLLGAGMKESRGSANPQELRKVFEELLS